MGAMATHRAHGRTTSGDRGTDDEFAVVIRDLVKTYPGTRKSDPVTAVDGVTLEVEPEEFFTLLGPSGCGKTTTLRSLAGLETPNEGEISLVGRTVFSSETATNVPGNERDLGMVFQSYAIWPHMTVYQNVGFPLVVKPRRRRPSRERIDAMVAAALKTVELDGLEQRSATALSGGQQQRLALARAMVGEPPVMLLDEPLSNLDAKLRDSMRLELKRLQRELKFTAIYVTHDQVEALALSNRIAVMKDGVVQQIARPREIYERPANQFVADFIGRSNFVPGTVRGLVDGSSTTHVVDTSAGQVRVTLEEPRASGTELTVCVRPEHVAVTEADGSAAAAEGIVGTIETRQFLGECIEYSVIAGGQRIEARTAPTSSLPPGTEVVLNFPLDFTRALS